MSPIHQDWPRHSCEEQYLAKRHAKENMGKQHLRVDRSDSKRSCLKYRQPRRLEEAGCPLCGAPTVSKTTGLMMMMMMMMMIVHINSEHKSKSVVNSF